MTRLRPIGVLVPCHAGPPERTLVDRLIREADHVLLVDDGMPSAEAAALGRLAAATGADVIHLPHRGKGHAVASGLAHLQAMSVPPAAVIVIDADGQHPPEAIGRFLEAAATADLVIGDRFRTPARVPPVRRVANRVTNALLSFATRQVVPDSQCGMRLLTGRALDDVRFPPGGFEAETRHLKRCLGAGVEVAWVPIPALYHGSRSSFRPLKDSVAVLAACLRP